jgi:hypothetical protein
MKWPREATMNKPKLPERVTAVANARVAAGEIVEIRNVTLRAVLKIVRDQIDRDQSREPK